MTPRKRTLYLLDAMALAYRAHFIFISRPLINSKGQNTSATYGFTAALVKLIEDHGIQHMCVVFDAHTEGGTFREKMYPEYKAHRDPPPSELLANLPIIKEIVRAMDIPVIEVEGVEADDVIGTLAREAEKDEADVVIVSPDKDFQQLLSERIKMLRPAYRGESLDPVTHLTFHEKFGLKPDQFIDVLALMGDSADNVPGVYGIGEKTAIKLLIEYGTLENVIKHAAEVKGKRAREGLLNHAEDARMSKKLVTIVTDVPHGLDWHDFQIRTPDLPQLEALFLEYEFSSLYRRLLRVLDAGILPEDTQDSIPGAAPMEEKKGPQVVEQVLPENVRSSEIQGDLFSSIPDPVQEPVRYTSETDYQEDEVSYHLVTSLPDIESLVDRLRDSDPLCFDTETTSTDQMIASLVGISFAVEKGEAWYIPTPLPDGTSTEQILDTVRPLLESDAVKIGQNIKYDIIVLHRHGITVKGDLFDTMIAHYLISPDDAHGMDALARRYLGYRTIPISDLIGKGKSQISMRDVPPEQVAPYACEDADITLQLHELFSVEMTRTGVNRIAEDIEFPLIRVLAEMEMCGVLVDGSVLSQLSIEMAEDIEALELQIYEVAGDTFNIGSPVQLGQILFDKLKLPIVSRTSTGKPSTRENVLRELATEHELPALILDWRELSKLKSTYVDSLGGLAHPETGRVHTSYSQTTAATGRLSSSNPNLQNIPIRTARGREIRKAFVAPEGRQLMSADYAQIELRILAALSGDRSMAEAFENGEDIHSKTAALVYGKPVEKITRKQRSKAKEVNFGIPYGISAFGLAQRLRCPVSEARTLIESYRTSYPDVTRFLASQVESAREKGYVETVLGRRRYVPDIHARNRNVRSFAERVAVNMPIQGTQADMIKIAMIRIMAGIHELGFQSRMLMQVHDELVFEVVPEEIEGLQELVRKEMVEALPLSVPVEVEMNSGSNWLEAH